MDKKYVSGDEAAGSVELDALDLRILDVLQRDASVNNLALSRLVHASAPTCLRRVKRLVDAGVIEKQVAILRPEALGSALTAIIEVSLDRQDTDAQKAFEALATAESAVLQCYRVSPGPDFILIAQVPDMPAYQAVAERLFASAANVRTVRTFFSIRRAKFETRIPMPV